MNATINIGHVYVGPFQNNLLGVNTEITRRGFFGGLSAEMLNNRKMFAGIDMPFGWECDGLRYVKDRQEESLCGSNWVILDNGTLSQSSDIIALENGREYECRLWIKPLSEHGAVTFGISGQERSFTVESGDAPYILLSFVFESEKKDNVSFRIAAEGEIAVFEASLRPTDHFWGMRKDVIELLKQVGPTSIRFPGGCAADHFDWKESLKPAEFRTPTDGSSKWFLFPDTYGQDCLDIGLNEFIMLCREVGAEPEYTVSLLLSDGEDARRLVEYCNCGPDTEYGAIRESLGFNGFCIRNWFIGNEAYFFGDSYQANGALAAERTNELTNAMRRADPRIKTVVGLTWPEAYHKWNRDFLAHLTCKYDYVSYHNYVGMLKDPVKGIAGTATCEELEAFYLDEEDYGLSFYKDGLFGEENFDGMQVFADEWNYSWGKKSSNALFFSNALQFHFLAKSYEKYHIVRAEFFMPINEGMITVNGVNSKLESTGEMFRLMKNQKDGILVKCTTNNECLDILCSKHDDGTLYLSIINRFAEPCKIDIDGDAVISCAEIRTGEYSFTDNDYTVCTRDTPIVSGHSVLFLSIRHN